MKELMQEMPTIVIIVISSITLLLFILLATNLIKLFMLATMAIGLRNLYNSKYKHFVESCPNRFGWTFTLLANVYPPGVKTIKRDCYKIDTGRRLLNDYSSSSLLARLRALVKETIVLTSCE
uniref:Uncharacterized protein n=1 Tax=Anopheles culicifacies TaxID=139723 RepID=A0A182MB05_9DIPT